MIRSMYSGVAGLKSHQLKMDVIGNNIANVNTYGFKAGRATFSDMFSQTLSGATQANAAGTLGGVDPRQVGLGTMNSTIDNIHTAGAFQSTDRTLDVTIIDEGFFPVTDGADVYYTRAGNLYIDSFGYLITAGGQYLMGMMLLDSVEPTDDTTVVEQSVLDKLDADSANVIWGSGKEDNTQIADLVEGGLPIYKQEADEIMFGEESQYGFGRIVVPTYYREISVDEAGVVKGTDEFGNAVEIAVLVTATFMNPGGLTKVGENLYQESSNSGLAAYGLPGVGPNGSLKVGGLEMSNVDLANEFTSMIVTQRGYQSNSRVITVSDTLLEELINLKR